MIELTNTRQWKDEPMADYISRWCSLSLDCTERRLEILAVEMCMQGMHWGMLYIFQGIANHGCHSRALSNPRKERKERKKVKRTSRWLEILAVEMYSDVAGILDILLRKEIIELPESKRPKESGQVNEARCLMRTMDMPGRKLAGASLVEDLCLTRLDIGIVREQALACASKAGGILVTKFAINNEEMLEAVIYGIVTYCKSVGEDELECKLLSTRRVSVYSHCSSYEQKAERHYGEYPEMISGINTRLNSVSNEKEHGEASHNRNQRSDANNGGGGGGGGGSSGTYLPKMVKLDFPKFNGDEDPTSWVCRADQFFDFHQTPDEEKVPLASFNLEGDAQVWYQLIKEEQGVISWPTFKEELHVRYGPTQFQDFFGDLTKLQQSGTVKEYQTQFERTFDSSREIITRAAVRNLNTRRNTAVETKKVVSSPSGPNSSNMPVKRLSPAELSERRAKGSRNPQTMRIQGKIDNKQVSFLIDSGSTHNFLSTRIAKKMGLVPSCEGDFEVIVANGEKLASSGRCKEVQMVSQGVPLVVDFFLLPLEGYDAVLGAQWLSTLGPIVWDFSKLCMTFTVGEREVNLQGTRIPENRVVGEAEFTK
ncbi:hypothetical protein RJ639_033188 [Escallonia herrerae]|uniref:Retrotransposon gag domain-containing protein n=1 Tax=Escallonia herrerae TaxID=1293975 RepID=A0AA89BL17_9ASTE|nr:hypothetical protein RJ639_033188 [Escallonia herrerae]